MDDVGLFYGKLVHFTVIWSISWPFGIFYGRLLYFTMFWYIVPKNNLAALVETYFCNLAKKIF
jgi:hypothetical protein